MWKELDFFWGFLMVKCINKGIGKVQHEHYAKHAPHTEHLMHLDS